MERVALLAEGVGRNVVFVVQFGDDLVALLAEGVGRNSELKEKLDGLTKVALLAEGVGRNRQMQRVISASGGGPPRGGRG